MIPDFEYTFLPMSSLDPHLPLLLLFIVETVIYLAVIGMVLRRRAGQESAAYLTSLYAALALLLQSIEAAWQAGLLNKLTFLTLEQLHWYGTLALSFLLALILLAFLQKRGNEVWLGAGILWAMILSLLSYNSFQLPDVLWPDEVWALSREWLGFGVAVFGWVIFMGGAMTIFRSAYISTRQPLHRNRLTYWLPIFFFTVSADILIINNLANWGAPLRLIGTWLLGYIIVTHHLPDVQQIMRSALIYIITTILAILFYLAGFSFAQYAFPYIAKDNPLFIGAAIALLLAIIFRPLFGVVEHRVDRWLRIVRLDAGRTLNEYSQTISNILDMERLANVTVGLIMEVMDIQRGFLFLVDRESGRDERDYYRLRAIRSAGERPIQAILLDTEGPVAQHLTREQRPLLQFDLDLLPIFKKSHPEERISLNRLDAEVYVPIFAKREWIGLFALGGKLSGNRYTKENLIMLSALAGQTAVALENARLVENLIQLNKKVRNAYRDLDETKQNLELIDRTKSDFISIASHELRTPLTVMRGYTEMLLENPSLDESILQMLNGIHDGTLRLHEIMDSLFDIAQIDARTLQLQLEPINVAEVVHTVSVSLTKSLKERDQSLTIDLPPLPGIHADPNTLRKVFYHLITNAIKFTPNGGEITVDGRTLPFSDEDMPEGGLEIVVSDTGIGIDPAFKEIIFTKFYQPDEQLNKHSTGKTKFKGSGTGLGLALARGIVEAHGGKIWVKSPGYDEVHFPGSEFHVILPLRRKTQGNTLPIGAPIKTKI